jgi:hypothetical protein
MDIMRTKDPIECLRGLCADVGFDLDRADASLLDRMRLLADQTESVSDAERMVAIANAVFRHYDSEKPADAFNEAERRIVVLGCLFADVGKTGPRDASPADRTMIAAMFAVENVRDDTMPVARFFETYFASDAADRIARFSALGLAPSMTIREFWNHHGGWTLAIAEAAGLPVDCVAAAATHHLLENVNPDAIVGHDGRFTRDFGANVAFDRAEKLVIVIDKYDALRRRGKRTHEQACAWLRERVSMSQRFRGDHEFETLIADIEAVLGRHDTDRVYDSRS